MCIFSYVLRVNFWNWNYKIKIYADSKSVITHLPNCFLEWWQQFVLPQADWKDWFNCVSAILSNITFKIFCKFIDKKNPSKICAKQIFNKIIILFLLSEVTYTFAFLRSDRLLIYLLNYLFIYLLNNCAANCPALCMAL